MLNDNQTITYRKGDRVESVIDKAALEKVVNPSGTAFSVRNAAFFSEGSSLIYPRSADEVITTSAIANVLRDGDTFHYRTGSGSHYSVEFEGIDVAAMVREGFQTGMIPRGDGGMKIADFPSV